MDKRLKPLTVFRADGASATSPQQDLQRDSQLPNIGIIPKSFRNSVQIRTLQKIERKCRRRTSASARKTMKCRNENRNTISARAREKRPTRETGIQVIFTHTQALRIVDTVCLV